MRGWGQLFKGGERVGAIIQGRRGAGGNYSREVRGWGQLFKGDDCFRYFHHREGTI